MIWGTRSFPRVAVLDLVLLSTWDGVLRESLELPKGSQATCRVWWGTWDGSGANAGESGLILSWFVVHGALLCCCGDFRVPLDLWQCSWGLSGVPSRKSSLLLCLMGNTDLLCKQCRGIGPHLAGSVRLIIFLELKWEPAVCSGVTAGMALQNSCGSVTSGLLSTCEGQLGILLEAWQGNRSDSQGKAGDPVRWKDPSFLRGDNIFSFTW